jgi:hypothetical protein
MRCRSLGRRTGHSDDVRPFETAHACERTARDLRGAVSTLHCTLRNATARLVCTAQRLPVKHAIVHVSRARHVSRDDLTRKQKKTIHASPRYVRAVSRRGAPSRPLPPTAAASCPRLWSEVKRRAAPVRFGEVRACECANVRLAESGVGVGDGATGAEAAAAARVRAEGAAGGRA